MSKLISVIVPVYNVEKYLNRCIQSIVEQEYKNLEIILINDGSTDGSLEICELWKERDERIILINKENSGVSDSRNEGINIATGDYIGFVDSDDFLQPDMYKKLLNNILKYDSQVSICSYRYIKDTVLQAYKYENKLKIYSNSELLKEIFLGKSINGFLWNKIFKKNLFDEIRLESDLELCEDLLLITKIIKQIDTAIYTSEKLYNYTLRENSATNDIRKIFVQNALRYEKPYSMLLEVFEDNDEMKKYIKLWYIECIRDSVYKLIVANYDSNIINKYIKELRKNLFSYLLCKDISFKRKVTFLLVTILPYAYKKFHELKKKMYKIR
ncbi:glycosyltransferase family 2 protein [Clostridium sp. D43t1_170807_H7]|uniref:glycosyltransferase family 2 protein n=1 Tax=Clostridium sp. D43t1_170807_H7 TaxID=2787140 RepID=UPI001899A564|nr:glycosyltransferase family 2 protein [Clostridium sp. D43t1_170807_H7]